jgi:hypothetical protein
MKNRYNLKIHIPKKFDKNPKKINFEIHLLQTYNLTNIRYKFAKIIIGSISMW